jgi:hypothetical protein
MFAQERVASTPAGSSVSRPLVFAVVLRLYVLATSFYTQIVVDNDRQPQRARPHRQPPPIQGSRSVARAASVRMIAHRSGSGPFPNRFGAKRLEQRRDCRISEATIGVLS